MGESSNIEWTDHTFNIAWGCEQISPGCDNCYAKAWAKRTGLEVWGPDAPRRTFGERHWIAPIGWNARAEKAGRVDLVFCSSMADVFEDHPTIEEQRAKLRRRAAQRRRRAARTSADDDDEQVHARLAQGCGARARGGRFGEYTVQWRQIPRRVR